MIGKAIALIQVPNQRAYRTGAAAKYLGCDTETLFRHTRDGLISARELNGRRIYLLEELDRFLESLPVWNNAGRSQALPATSERKISNAGR